MSYININVDLGDVLHAFEGDGELFARLVDQLADYAEPDSTGRAAFIRECLDELGDAGRELIRALYVALEAEGGAA